MASLRKLIGKVVPQSVRDSYGRYKWEQELKRRKERNAQMSVEEVFTEIYQQNQWGGKPGEFYSGWGSEDEICTTPYINAVRQWLTSENRTNINLVDLGCGDFRIGRHFVDTCDRYVGADVVKDLITYNQTTFGNEKVRFQHLDIINEELPEGNVCFVRQVLQHLSNDEIKKVLDKICKYDFAIVTEHYPLGLVENPNLDKVHGFDVRITQKSAVVLDKPPFNIESERIKLLVEVKEPLFPGSDEAVLKTFLIDFR